MYQQKESGLTWAFAVISLFLIFSLCCFNDDLANVGDSVFLYNRCLQARECFRNGVYPFLYYEDIGGIGYGSPIFYGQLTLFPFMLFVDNISVFVKVYFLSCLLLNFFGFRCFIKRISSYATLMSCLYVTSIPFVCFYNANIPANVLAVGFSWFFFAFCIDYFRDSKGFFLVILTYFLIWQSNMNSTILATFVCVGIFFVYFDKRRWRDYLKLCVCVLTMLGYNIANILVHLDALRLEDPSAMLTVLNVKGDARVFSPYPLGGFFLRLYIDVIDCCCGFMSFGLFAVFCYYVCRGIRGESLRFKACSIAIVASAVAGYIIGISTIWDDVYKATNLFFQFPIRYFILLFGFVLAILSRFIQPRWFVYAVLGLSIIDLFLVNPMQSLPTNNMYYEGLQLANCEYASNSFVRDYDTLVEYRAAVHSTSGASYEFTRGFNEVTVDCSSNYSKNEVLTLPKLYYVGYVARGADGRQFKVTSGYSNYCKVAISDYRGELTLRYEVPIVVFALFIVQVACIVVYLVGALLWSTYWKKFLKMPINLSK